VNEQYRVIFRFANGTPMKSGSWITTEETHAAQNRHRLIPARSFSKIPEAREMTQVASPKS